jgi:uncharacterized repeat protein (TIGR01451 family)
MSRFLLQHLLGKCLRRLSRRPRKAPKAAKRTVRPSLEHLERRDVPSFAPTAALVKDINPGFVVNSNPTDLTNIGDKLYFNANNGNTPNLWQSDGTSAGTTLFLDSTGSAILDPRDLTSVNHGLFFFSAIDVGHAGNRDVWVSDGLNADTGPLLDNTGSPVINNNLSSLYLTDVNGEKFFVAQRQGVNSLSLELWQTDNTSRGTFPVLDTNGQPILSPSNLANVNGTLFFSANAPGATSGNTELWTFRTGLSQPVPQPDNHGSPVLTPSELTNVGGKLFFSARGQGANSGGFELWESNGIAGGTAPVLDNTGAPLLVPGPLTDVSGTLFLAALGQGANSTQFILWKSDGTSNGTAPVLDNTGALIRNPFLQTNVNGTLFFAAQGQGPNSGNFEMWHNNTSAGTVPLLDNNGSFVLNPGLMANVSGSLFFPASGQGVNATASVLWETDGTSTDTAPILDNTGIQDVFNPRDLTNVGGNLFFTSNGGITGRELWAALQPAGLGVDFNDPGGGTPGVSPGTVTAGQTITYTINLFNSGPADAQNVVMTETLPPGVTGTLTALPGNPDSFTILSNGTANIAASAIGPVGMHIPFAEDQFTLVVTVPSGMLGGTFTNTAAVGTTTTNQGSPRVFSVSDNVVTSTDLSVSMIDPGKLTGTGPPLTVTAGSTITYTISVQNTGPSDAQNVALTDTLPTGVSGTLTPLAGNLDSFTVTGLTASATSVVAGHTDMFTLVTTVPRGQAAGSTFSNRATISTTTTNPVPPAVLAFQVDDTVIRTSTSPPPSPSQNSTTVTLLTPSQISALMSQSLNGFFNLAFGGNIGLGIQELNLFINLLILQIESGIGMTDQGLLQTASNQAFALAAIPASGITIP